MTLYRWEIVIWYIVNTNVLISAALNSIFCLQQLKLLEVILNQYEQCVTWSRWCVGGHRSRVQLAWMAEDSLKVWLVYWSDTTGWQLCLVAAATAAESLADNTAASSVARYLLRVSVFWRSRRGPHLHDGIHHTTICMNWWSRENCGKWEMQFCNVKKKTNSFSTHRCDWLLCSGWVLEEASKSASVPRPLVQGEVQAPLGRCRRSNSLTALEHNIFQWIKTTAKEEEIG